MAQAAGLYLFWFPKYRQGNVRNRVKFLIPGPLKIVKKLILPNGREKIQNYVTGRENLNGASRRSVSLFVSEISPGERSESCEIFNTRTFENFRKNWLFRMIVKNFSIAQQDEKIRMAQAAGLYLFSFPRYRQGNVRNRVKFLIPGPLKICEKINCSVTGVRKFSIT